MKTEHIENSDPKPQAETPIALLIQALGHLDQTGNTEAAIFVNQAIEVLAREIGGDQNERITLFS